MNEQIGTPEPKSKSLGARLIRIYMMIGTILFYPIYQLEQLIADLVEDFSVPLLASFTAQKWHAHSVAMTMWWPLLVPIILIRDVALLIYAVLAFVWVIAARLVKAAVDSAFETQSFLKSMSDHLHIIWYDSVKPRADGSPVTSEDLESLRDALSTGGERLKDSLSSAGERTGNVLGSAGERIGGAFESASERASSAVNVAGDRIGSAVGDATGKVGGLVGSEDSSSGDTSRKPTDSTNGQAASAARASGDDTATMTVSDDDESASAQTPPAQRININTAPVKALTDLPGVGPALAKRIIAHRTENGDFTDLESLTAVNGIGQNMIDQLDSLISFD